MSKVTFIIVFLCCLLAFAVGYGTTITRSTATTSSISDFYQDFSYCSCDVTPSLCDNYCCCDASCSSVNHILDRLQLLLGHPHPVVFHHLRQYKVFVMTPQPKDLVHFKTFPVFTFQIEELLDIFITILKPHQYHTQLQLNCTNKEI